MRSNVRKPVLSPLFFLSFLSTLFHPQFWQSWTQHPQVWSTLWITLQYYSLSSTNFVNVRLPKFSRGVSAQSQQGANHSKVSSAPSAPVAAILIHLQLADLLVWYVILVNLIVLDNLDQLHYCTASKRYQVFRCLKPIGVIIFALSCIYMHLVIPMSTL